MKKTRFIITTNIVNKVIIDLLKDLYKNLKITKYDNCMLMTYTESFDQSIESIMETINIDFGESIHVHEGFILNDHFCKEYIDKYIEQVIKFNLLKSNYTNLVDLFYHVKDNGTREVLNDYYIYILKPVLEKNDNRLIIETFFNNNLNRLKTSKDLYMNRNSLTKRLETMSKVLGYNIQDFNTASMILFIMRIY